MCTGSMLLSFTWSQLHGSVNSAAGISAWPGTSKRVVERKRGHPVGRTQIREDEPAELARGIRALPHALAQAAARGLARRLETAPVDVVHPAVVAAAQAALERNGELERRAAMRAVQVEHADAPAAIAEDHEIFAQDAHAARRAVQIAREGHRLPEAPQVLAAGRAGTDLGELGIGGRRRSARVSVERAAGRGLRGHECRSAWGRSGGASRVREQSPGHATSSRCANLPWWVGRYSERSFWAPCQPENTI